MQYTNVGDLTQLEKFRGWYSCDWESFPKNQKGHHEIVRRLKTICKSKYNLKIEKFKRAEAWIAVRHSYGILSTMLRTYLTL